VDDAALDRLLGIRPERIEAGLRLVTVLRAVGNEKVQYDGVPYALLRSMLRWARLGARDVFYDLGAGYGRALFYGALTTSARFRGIEIVPERVAAMIRVRDRLGLDTVDVRQGNASDEDIDDGTFLFLFNPFFRTSLRKVGEHLHHLAGRKAFRLATVAVTDPYFRSRPWLVEVPFPLLPGTIEARFGMRVYRTRAGVTQ
jgi:hypothetical protein